MLWAEHLLLALQRQLLYLFGLGDFALFGVEVPWVVDCVERRRVFYTECPLCAVQHPLVRLLVIDTQRL